MRASLPPLPPSLAALRDRPELQLDTPGRVLPPTILARSLASIDRRHPALCGTCFGMGIGTQTWWVHIVACAQERRGCTLGPLDGAGHRQPLDLCPQHRCHRCEGLGIQCPTCHGTNVLVERLRVGAGDVDKPCWMCQEGRTFQIGKMLGGYRRFLGYKCAERECGYERHGSPAERALAACPGRVDERGQRIPCGSTRSLAQVLKEDLRVARARGELPAYLRELIG